MNRTVRCTTLAVLLAMTAGCAVGPDFQRPAAPVTPTYVAGTLPEQTASASGLASEAQRFAHGQEVQAQWWKAFGSPALDELVAAALQANPDLKAAEAALRAARETAAAQRGAFWPKVDAGVSSTRQQTPGPLAGPLVDPDVARYTLHTAQLSVGYVPDVFGANRRQAEALSAEVEVQRFQREAVYMTLVSNVVNAAIEEASLRAQIAATHDLIMLATRLLDLSCRAHQAGQIGGADVAAQEAALAQAQAALPPLEKQLAEQHNQLAVLAGRLPSEQAALHFELASLSLPSELPVSLPSRLVEQRPDIRAAEAQLHAASAQLGVATAARLPNLTLTATLGGSALDLPQLFRSGSGFWSVGGDLLQPIFQGRTLMHQQRAAEATYDQAAARYRSTVLAAFQNSADALQAIVSDADTLRAASASDAAAKKSLAMVRRRHALGATTQTEVILAQQTGLQAALTLAQAQARRYTNTVALYMALGGWWQERGATGGQIDENRLARPADD